LSERRTGIIGLGARAAFSGRKRWEDQYPEVAAVLRPLAEAHAQHDPTAPTTLAYTRITTKAALASLGTHGYRAERLPSPTIMAEVLKRMGFRLRKVVKAKPQKKIAETDAIFANIEKKTREQRPCPASPV